MPVAERGEVIHALRMFRAALADLREQEWRMGEAWSAARQDAPSQPSPDA